MNYKAKDLFPEWYKHIDPSAIAQTFTDRNKSIETILQIDDFNFWEDVIKMGLDILKEDSTHKVQFIKEFKDVDVSFPYENNENILRGLSSILLCIKLESEVGDLNNIISLSILNSLFLRKLSFYENIPVEKCARTYISNQGLKSRSNISKIDFDTLNSEIGSNITDDTEYDPSSLEEGVKPIVEALKPLVETNKLLLEQVNILWWLFGEYSEIENTYFKDAGPLKMTIVGAKELSELTQFTSGLFSAQHILNKVVAASQKDKVRKLTSIAESINTLSSETKTLLLKNSKTNLVFTPCISAIEKSLQSTKKDDWILSYKSENYNTDVNKEITLQTLSHQFYNEFIYLNNILSYAGRSKL